jgi:hypothetical protein
MRVLLIEAFHLMRKIAPSPTGMLWVRNFAIFRLAP